MRRRRCPLAEGVIFALRETSFARGRDGRLLLLAGLAALAALCADREALSRGELPAFFRTFCAQALAYLLAVRCAGRLGERDAGALTAVLVLGLAMRAVLLPLPVFLTTDLQRYAHDGAVTAAGGNPYAQTPEQRNSDATVPHGSVGTVYPPGAQALFGVAARAGGGEPAFKALALAADLLVLAAFLVLAPHAGWRAVRCVAWAWHPLVLWAFAGSGHVDAAAIALTLAALAAALDRRSVAASALLGLGAAVKLAPLALVAAWRGALGRAAWLAPAVLALAYLPFREAGARLFDGPLAYAGRWEHMGFVYTPLAAATSPTVARSACYAGMAWLLWRCARSPAPLVERTRQLIGGALLLTPTLHPWYVCWVVPLYEPVSRCPFLVLSLTAVGGYGVLLARPELGTWGRTGWWWYVTWVPVALAMCLRTRRESST